MVIHTPLTYSWDSCVLSTRSVWSWLSGLFRGEKLIVESGSPPPPTFMAAHQSLPSPSVLSEIAAVSSFRRRRRNSVEARRGCLTKQGTSSLLL